MDDKEKVMKAEETAAKKEDNGLVTDFDTLHNRDKKDETEKSKAGDDGKKAGAEEPEQKKEVRAEKSKKTEDAKAEEAKKKEDVKTEEPKKKEEAKAEEAKKKEDAKAEEPKKKEDAKAEEPKKKEEAKTEEPKKDADAVGKKTTENKEEAKPAGDKPKTAAISQSKRLADAKAAKEAEASEAAPPKKKSSGGKKALWIVLGSMAALICIVYIAGFIYFSNHFYQDVAINGVNVSSMDKAGAKQVLDQFYQDYILTIITIEDKEIPLKGSDISMKIVLQDKFDGCFSEQHAELWFVNMFEHHDFEIGADASWDEAALSEQFSSMSLLNQQTMVAPRDAYVSVEESKFAIVKEVLGTTLDEEKFKNAVTDSLRGVQFSLKLVDAGCYELPKVYETDEELVKELEAKNEYADRVIKIQMDDLTLEPGMQLYEDILEKSGDSYVVSKELVNKYVKKLAAEYDTMGKERVFTTSFSSKKVTVNGTAFGYELNQEETTNKLYSALTSGKAATVEAVFNEKGYTLTGENDIGNTYVEVNLSEQKVVAYKNGKKIAEGDCVSGKESVGHGTCIGLYAIQDKLSPTVLRGEKKPVSKTEIWFDEFGQPFEHTTTTMEYDYESPVTFWMQFNGGIGLHDAAQWRSAYGGSIYYYSGSHGCVNLPYDLAKTLYENFQIGDPVVVYFWDNENRR
ncbi:MAG: L,D-transpeptidase/peptidoglycan binding protein [Bacteroidales bacterium]|nr:L,D-transpeptidase/peptidoglycan binding protein [Clostridium sp.]MCM1203024.1 L,D-transpeptidase/peptidoglycan binding protein [Bacteroidales bacterium]